ncbi:unnamed protein product, partial [marine sediment metagenome]
KILFKGCSQINKIDGTFHDGFFRGWMFSFLRKFLIENRP